MMFIEEKNPFIESKNFTKAGFLGGAIGGFIIAILVIVMKWINGFNGIPKATLLPIMLFFGTLTGGIAGWLCCWFAIAMNRTYQKFKTRLLFEILFFVTGFIIIALAHQLPARDALRKPGTYKVIDDVTGKKRPAGGPIGEPDFETVATGLVGGFGFLILARGLCRIRNPKDKVIYAIAIHTTVVGVTIWSFVYVIYEVLLNFEILEHGYAPFGSTAVFRVDFPHPVRALLFILICLLYIFPVTTTISIMVKKEKPGLPVRDQEFINKINAIIKEKMSDPDFGPAQLAAAIPISNVHLNRKLKKLTNQNTSLYIRGIRLRYAAQLLKQGFGNVSEIADKVGFSDLNYFSRCFKAYFNISPKDYPQ